MVSLYSQMAKGAVWMVAFKLLDRLIGLCSMIVLARLLVPADFGLVAMAMAVIAALEVLGAFSFDVALIQRQDADRSHYDTAWTFNVCIGAATSVVVFALAGPTAGFYDEPRLVQVLHVLAVVPIVGGLENIGVVAFRKEMRFDREFGFMLSKRLMTTSVTIVLAFAWRSYEALLAGMVAGRVFGTAISFVLSRYRPRLSLSRRDELLHFSAWLFLNNILSFISNRFSTFVLGKTVRAEAFGIYSLATEISFLPTTELVAPINRAVFPAYARMGSDLAGLRLGYLRVTGIMALFAVPAALGLAVTASVFVPLVFGEQWNGAVPLIQVLACYGAIQALQNNAHNVFYSLGRPRFTTLFSLIYNILMIPALIYFSIRWGTTGASYALLLAGTVVAPLTIGAVMRLLHLRIGSVFSIMWRPFLAGMVMVGLVLAVKQLLARQLAFIPAAADLLILIATGAATYMLASAGLWAAASRPDGAERDAFEMLRRVLGKVWKASPAGNAPDA